MKVAKSGFLMAFVVAIFFAGCGRTDNKKEQWIDNITKAEQKLDSLRRQTPVNTSETFELIAMYVNYADTFKQDSLSPVFLYRAAENSLYINQPLQAITYLKRIEADYPSSPMLGNVLFLIGFTYDNNLKNYFDAQKYYELFVEKFPDHPLANDTRILLQNLGKSPEELIKEFESKNRN